MRTLYQTYKYNAKRRGLKFELELSSFRKLVEDDCHYCGDNPRTLSKKNFSLAANGVDRKENTKGYTLRNCVTCCSTCNTAKMTKSYAEFTSWLKRLVEFQSKAAEVRYKNTIVS